MPDPGEEIVGEYLRLFLGCDFVEYNLHTKEEQGEIDVVGINTEKKAVYICEVATHLQTGLQYTKNKRPDNVDRLTDKFKKDIRYANRYYKDYEKHFMLWSPIVKNPRKEAEHNQMRDVKDIKLNLHSEFQIDLELVINQEYDRCLKKLRERAAEETKALKSPILRLMQIEEKLIRHVEKLDRSSERVRIIKLDTPDSRPARPSSSSVATSPTGSNNLTRDTMTQKQVAMLAGLFLSKFGCTGFHRLGFRSFEAAYESIGQKLDIPPNTIRNHRDEFDPLFHDNGRVGWRPGKPRRRPIMEMYERYGSLNLDDFANLVEQKLTEYVNRDR